MVNKRGDEPGVEQVSNRSGRTPVPPNPGNIITPVVDNQFIPPHPTINCTLPCTRPSEPSHQLEWETFLPLYEKKKPGEILTPFHKMEVMELEKENLKEPQVFFPSSEQFSKDSRYLQFLEYCGFYEAGICKIVPPLDWNPRPQGYDDVTPNTSKPKLQMTNLTHGRVDDNVTYLSNECIGSMTLERFNVYVTEENPTPPHANLEELEKIFWKTLVFHPSIYLSDQDATLFQDTKSESGFDLRNLKTALLKHGIWKSGNGIITPWLYTGTFGSRFAWHTEDKDLLGLNYHHKGAPKSWDAIPAREGRNFENIMAPVLQILFPGLADLCPEVILHKSVMTNPDWLRDRGITVNKVVQFEGEFVAVAPFAYHQGWNHGVNFTEAVNYLTQRGLEYCKRAIKCPKLNCRLGSPSKIDLKPFIKNMQPEKYSSWLKGTDVGRHPENNKTAPETACGKHIVNLRPGAAPPQPKKMARVEDEQVKNKDQQGSHNKSARKTCLQRKKFTPQNGKKVAERGKRCMERVDKAIKDLKDYSERSLNHEVDGNSSASNNFSTSSDADL